MVQKVIPAGTPGHKPGIPGQISKYHFHISPVEKHLLVTWLMAKIFSFRLQLDRCMFFKHIYSFLYKHPHFPVEPRVAIGSAQNEAESCYEDANVF